MASRWGTPWLWGAGAVIALIAIVLLFRMYSASAAPAQALEKLATAQSYHVTSELTLNLPVKVGGRERPFHQIIGRIDGDVVRNAAGTPEITGALFGQALGTGEKFILNGMVHILNDAVLFRLTEFPVLLNPTGSLRNTWTMVPATLLQTKNSADIQAVLAEAVAETSPAGEETIGATEYDRYEGQLSPETKEKLRATLDVAASGNQGWHTIARLLRNNDATLSLSVDDDRAELRRVKVVFSRPASASTTPRAVLVLDFSDYGKAVTIDRPPTEATVRTDVFKKLFGG